VLRFRRDRLHIGIEPDRLSLVCLKGAFASISAPQVIASTSIALDENASESDRLDTLARELADRRWQNTEAHIVLSDRLARYFIAERPHGARNAGEVRQAVCLRFEDIFGEASDTWEIGLDMAPFAARQFACALRKTLVAGLIGACTGRRIRVSSLLPFAIAEYNRWQAALDGKSDWLAVLGRRSVWFGRPSGNGWASVNQYALEDDLATAFSRLLLQESLRAAANDVATAPAVSPVLCLAGDLTGATLRQRLLSPARRALGAVAWPGQSVEWSMSHRIALSPVWPACA